MQPIWRIFIYNPIFGLVLVPIVKHEDKSLLINECLSLVHSGTNETNMTNIKNEAGLTNGPAFV